MIAALKTTLALSMAGLLLVLLPACGKTATATAASTVSPHAPAAAAEALRSRNDLHDLRRIPWTSARTTGPKTIQVTVETGDDRCNGVHVEVRETATRVEVSTFLGSLPNSATQCETIATFQPIAIGLQHDVGGRQIVDPSAARR